MTVTNSARSVSLTGNGVTTVFPYSFLIPSGTSVVTLTDLTTSIAVEGEPLVEGVDYSITGEDDELGGTVTYPLSGSPLSSDYKINIKSEIEIEQTLDLTTQSAYNPTQLESQLDRMTLAILQVNEQITRAVLIATGSTTTAEELLTALSTVESSATAAAASASAASASAVAAAASAASISPVETQISSASVVAFLDADHIPARKAADGSLIKDTWASIKTAIWTALGGLINAGTIKATPVDADSFPIKDSASSNATKQVSMTALWANYLKAKADALYQPLVTILTTLGNLANASGVLTNNGAGVLSWGSSGGPTLLTEQATTSGASKDFTIPAGAKRVTIMLDGVSSNNSTDTIGVQLGDAGGIETTSYVSNTADGSGGDTTSTSQFLLGAQSASADTMVGTVVLNRMNGSHKWNASWTINRTNTSDIFRGAGIKTTSQELTTVRLLTSNTFDAGNVNVSWE